MRQTPLLGAIVLAASFCLTADAATLHPALEAAVYSGNSEESISVIAFLEEAPVQQLSNDLRVSGATRKLRHESIVNALQAQQETTQADLKAWLEDSMRNGSIRGYTSYWITNCVVVHATKSAVLEMAGRTDIETIELNWKPELIEPVILPGEEINELDSPGGRNRGSGFVPPGLRAIRADQVWAEFGITGAGRIVANMDTGVDGNHPALASRWRGVSHPPAESWLDVLGGSPNFPTDNHSHGTHVMGTITGNSPTTQDTVGVAWGAQWIASNAINQGVGGEFDNDVISSFQFFMNPDGDNGTFSDVPDVVQNSWGINEGFGNGYTDCDTRWWGALDNCEAAGVVVTFSAGNEGPGSQSHRSPADRATTAYNAFSVGAIDATNSGFPYPIAGFSSRGPSGCPVDAELKIKPEVSAPGVTVYSSVPGGGYQSSGWSGTSMAGPHVAGVVALIREADPNMEVDDIKQLLIDTAVDHGAAGNDNTYGWGVIDAYAAVEQALTGFGTLSGYVGNGSFGDIPLAGATITVIEESRSFVSDTDGLYDGVVAPGTFTVEASHPSFESQQFVVIISESSITTRDFSLTDIAGPTITNVTDLISTPDPGPYVVTADIEDASTVVGAELFYRVNGGAWESVAMAGFATYSASIPSQVPGTTVDYYVQAEDGIGLVSTEPAAAPAESFTLLLTEIAYSYDAEAPDSDWTLGAPGDDASTGVWERTDPNGTEDSGEVIQTEDDHTDNPGTICFVTGNASAGSSAGTNDVDDGCTTLLSPVFDLGTAQAAFVSYARWFMMGGASTDDVFRIEVSNDAGANWLPLETVTGYSPNWAETVLDVGAVLELTSQIQFQFIACDINTQGLTECAIDDFALEIFGTDPADAQQPAELVDAVLERNAPNPMASTTALRFRLSNSSDAHLAIYDAAGRLVRTLVDGPLSSGSHQIDWDGRDATGHEVEAGVYFYRLEANAFVQSRRLLVVR